ncbi:hypothetical protein [Paracoccus sp. 22332]
MDKQTSGLLLLTDDGVTCCTG